MFSRKIFAISYEAKKVFLMILKIIQPGGFDNNDDDQLFL